MLLLWALSCVVTIACLASPDPALAVAPALGLVAGLLFARQPAIALCLIVALIPYAALRKFGGAVNLPWLLAGGLVALLPLRMALEKRWPFAVNSAMWPLLMAYLFMNLVSAMLSPFPDDAFHAVTMIAAAQLFVALVIAYGDRDLLLSILPRVVVWSITGGSLLGIVGYVFGIAMFGEDRPDGAAYRANGGAIDPNNQCIMIVFAIPLMVHLAVHAKSRLERLVMSALVGLNVLGVMLTISRSGLMMCLLTLAILFVRYRSLITPRRLGAVVAAGMLGCVALLAVLPQSFYERQGSLAKWEDRSLSRRSSYLSVAWDAVQQRPLLGSGPDTFKEYYAESDVTRLYTKVSDRMARQAHNTYVEVLVGTGVVGLVLYLAVLHRAWWHFRVAENAFQRAGEAKAADLMGCYRVGFLVLLLFLLMMTEMYHKYMLLSLGLSQVALRVSGATEPDPARTAPVAERDVEWDRLRRRNPWVTS